MVSSVSKGSSPAPANRRQEPSTSLGTPSGTDIAGQRRVQRTDPNLAPLGRPPSGLSDNASASRLRLPLPNELIQEIASNLPPTGVYNASETSRDMYALLGPTRAVVQTDKQTIQNARPRDISNRHYARLLHDQAPYINGQPLTVKDIAVLTGANIADIKSDLTYPAELIPIREAFPRMPNESKMAFSRRLSAASLRDDPRMGGLRLSVAQIAALTGARMIALHSEAP